MLTAVLKSRLMHDLKYNPYWLYPYL